MKENQRVVHKELSHHDQKGESVDNENQQRNHALLVGLVKSGEKKRLVPALPHDHEERDNVESDVNRDTDCHDIHDAVGLLSAEKSAEVFALDVVVNQMRHLASDSTSKRQKWVKERNPKLVRRGIDQFEVNEGN